MRPIAVLVAGVFLFATQASFVLAQAISIKIDQVTANKTITGFVRGIALPDHRNYKVVVYVHTDQWYIHPYAGQDEGQSWAALRETGTWELPTVQREFRADKMAALLVRRDYPEPSKLADLDRIPYKAIDVRTLRGTPDSGKL